MNSFPLRIRGVRLSSWWLGAALLGLVACAGPETPAPDDDAAQPAPAASERSRREQSSSEPGADLGVPATRPPLSPAGCAGTCQQVCDCVAAACQRDGAGSCASREEECRAGCERSSCTEGDPACQPFLAAGQEPPPGDPEPAPPGPGPDPSPIDPPSDNASDGNASSGSSSSGGASSPAPGNGPGNY